MINKGSTRLYILMRNDLQSLTPGRCMAQANHAASILHNQFSYNSMVKEWKKQTPYGFGTTIVLSASKEQIDNFFANVPIRFWDVKGWVIDPDYVVRVTHEVASFMKANSISFLSETSDEKTIGFTREEKTCAFIMGTQKDFEKYIGSWPLA